MVKRLSRIFLVVQLIAERQGEQLMTRLRLEGSKEGFNGSNLAFLLLGARDDQYFIVPVR